MLEKFASIATASGDTEFYTPVPKGYSVGKTKYVVVTGSVMSGLGKGIFSSSIGFLFRAHGFKVSSIKFDGYLNVDAGTLNPYRHGEVFVLSDGTECDMDLGNYERFLDENFTKNNYLTGGKIFASVLEKERAGKYLGRDVQFIPHVTGEIKGFVRNLAVESSADIILIEVGGTIGDLENGYFVEAMRQLAYEEGDSNVLFVNVTYVPKPSSLAEQKSKPAQIGVRELMSAGVQPHLIVCRSSEQITDKVRDKISVYSNVPPKQVVGIPDLDTIYDVPMLLKKEGIDETALKVLGLKTKKHDAKLYCEWEQFVHKLKGAKKQVIIGITGKYVSIRDSYASILNALEHCEGNLGVRIGVKWIDTAELEKKGHAAVVEELKDVDGIIVPGGFGSRGTAGKIECIKYARENNLPYFGLCYGFQLALIEFARNACKLEDANSTEIDPSTIYPVIDLLPEQLKKEGFGGNMRLGGRVIELKKDTLAAKAYGGLKAFERFRHRFECNPDYIEKFEENGLVFSGRAPNHPIMQIFELPKHKFFLGTQFHPEFTSRPLAPNPLFKAFIEACLKK